MEPLIEEFFGLRKTSGKTIDDVAGRAGYHPDTLTKWRGHSPRLSSFIAALNAIGFTLKIVPLETKRSEAA